MSGGAPDNWEEGGAGGALNSDAPTFVPRAAALAFVPRSAMMAAPAAPAAPAPPAPSVPAAPAAPAPPPPRPPPAAPPALPAPAPALAADGLARQLETQAKVSPPAPAPSPPPAPAPPAPSAPSAPDDPSAAPALAPAVPLTDAERQAVLDCHAALTADDARGHLNVVFIGHVDAGKSTLGGQILYLTGGVDKRTIEKYEREAKDKNRESWYMAYIMDTNEEERAKGITVEVGRAKFETATRRYTILDAPGHKNYVPNMIMGAAQADVAVLLISSRKGEFETGFEKGGQTREHAQLAKTLGVSKLLVAVNKLDDPSVALADGGQGGVGIGWDPARFGEIERGLTPFLKSCGYNAKRDVCFIPISALSGGNVRDRPSRGDGDPCPWYTGPTLFEALDAADLPASDPLAPFRMPIVDRYRDMGTMVMGKSEQGLVRQGDSLLLMPNRVRVRVEAVFRDEAETPAAKAGENLRLRLSGCEDTDCSPGFVLCAPRAPCPVVVAFEAQVVVLELLEHNPVFTVGYRSVLHVHTAVEECEVTKLIGAMDPKTREMKKAKFVKSGAVAVVRVQLERGLCVEAFDALAAMGRFTLRDEGRTIAIGKITRLPKAQTVAGAGGAGASGGGAAA